MGVGVQIPPCALEGSSLNYLDRIPETPGERDLAGNFVVGGCHGVAEAASDTVLVCR